MKDALYACFILAAGVLGSSACAMTGLVRSHEWCHVIESEKLPARSGGAAALCDAISRAAAARGLSKTFEVQVRVGPRSMLSAEVTLPDGRSLAALNMAEMDREVSRDALNRFAVAIADHVISGTR
jgi:hypothetical protein